MGVHIMNEKQRKFAMLGGTFGVIYLMARNLLPSLPDVLMGVILGLGILFFVMALLPEKTRKKIRKWKRRGE